MCLVIRWEDGSVCLQRMNGRRENIEYWRRISVEVFDIIWHNKKVSNIKISFSIDRQNERLKL